MPEVKLKKDTRWGKRGQVVGFSDYQAECVVRDGYGDLVEDAPTQDTESTGPADAPQVIAAGPVENKSVSARVKATTK